VTGTNRPPESTLRVLSILRRESAVTLAREAIWRTRKRWKQARLVSDLSAARPVHFRPAGYYRPELGRISDCGRKAILACADSVCAGEFPWFGYGRVALGIPPRWNLDFVSGREWPRVPAEALTIVRHDGSDVKVPWELSRLQFLPVLGKAWLLTADARYRTTARTLLSDWIAKNPVGEGVNWTIAMEAALRSMSICFLLELLWPFAPEETGWLCTVTQSLQEHLLYIEAHNEFSHLARSNHYLSNIVGLFALSCFLQGEAMISRRRRYMLLVTRELFHQTYADGGDFEASLGYHVLVLQMFTAALLLMRGQQLDPQPAYVERVRNMCSLLEAVADAEGNVPQVGDCDDGRVELLTDDVRQLSATGSRRDSLCIAGFLGLGSALVQSPGLFHGDDAAWHGLTPHGESIHSAPQPVVCFPESGVAVARKAEAQVLFFAMPNGIAGRGSHTHNDKLSLVARLGGSELLADSGTYGYTRDPGLRNRFRSTRSHNTVMVDGEEQNRISLETANLFRLADDAAVSEITTWSVDGSAHLKASHSGYSRIGVVHTRTLSLAEDRVISLLDQLTGTGEHSIELFFHLPACWQVRSIFRVHEDLVCELNGPRAVAFSWRSKVALEGEYRAAKISRAFGSWIAATQIRIHGRAQVPLQISTQIRWTT